MFHFFGMSKDISNKMIIHNRDNFMFTHKKLILLIFTFVIIIDILIKNIDRTMEKS